MPDYTDEEIIKLLRSADKRQRDVAMTHLYEQFYPMIAKFILQNNGSEYDAEDIFQDGLVVFYEKVVNSNFVATSALKTFVYSICRNLWYKKLRKASNREIPSEHIQSFAEEAVAYEKLVIDEQTTAIANLMQQLGGDCKRVLFLYYYEKKRMKEISEIMNYSGQQVAKNKKNLCMKKLRKLAKDSSIFKNFK